ncbi:hypothetical protein GCM10022223_37910 [Kineosporia mesophila]|uniref:Uncharacterized protein n=1 Tax=Kineosporia mesophila TaxID=566012 RepID=A0ABP6ZR31_9ACTN|nr:hypothetical protein [Kineosporia mesophila]MCD5349786.1 hypothetical protein [Kineosporia mesophila]
MLDAQGGGGMRFADEVTVRVRLGDAVVAVRSRVKLVLETVAEFYPLATVDQAPSWTFTAEAAPADGATIHTGFGVGVDLDRRHRSVRLRSESAFSLAVTTRKLVREVFLESCETAGYTMVHASAVYNDEQVIVFAADKRGGKTTLALRCVLDHGWRWLSNDHLILLRDRERGLLATSLPTPIPVKAGTVVDLWDRLPEPWDFNDFDVDHWRRIPPSERYRADDAVYFTFSRFQQANPVLLPLKNLRIALVFPSYLSAADGEAPVVSEVGAVSSAGALADHLRLDWLTEGRLSERFIASSHRDAMTFARDGVRLTGQLAATASSMRYQHAGDPAPLLHFLREKAS